MKKPSTLFLLLILMSYSAMFTSCMASMPMPYEESMADKGIIGESLFSSDIDVLSNEVVERILSGELVYQENLRIVVLKIPTSRSDIKYYGYYYWRTEEYLDIQEEYNTIITDTLTRTGNVEVVKILPSMMIPDKITIPAMREAAVRMQAHLLLVYKIQSDIFEKFRWFKKKQLKSFATCEAFLLDTKTGIIPFSTIITEKYITEKIKDDANDIEATKRAEREAIILSLKELCLQINQFFLEL